MRVAVFELWFAAQILPAASTETPVLPAPVGVGTLPTKAPSFFRWPIVQPKPQNSDELTQTSPFAVDRESLRVRARRGRTAQ